jgi:hypothetical protein
MASTVCPAENVIACWVGRLPEGGLLAFRGLLPHRSPLQIVNNLLLTPFFSSRIEHGSGLDSAATAAK